MHLSFTFRSTETNDALKDYAREKLDRIHKYFPEPIKVHVVYSQQRGYLHAADIQITLPNGLVVKGVEASDDFFSAVDLVMAKIERQLRRYKGPDPRSQAAERSAALADAPSVLGGRAWSDDGKASPREATSDRPAAAAPAPMAKPQVIKEDKFIAEPMSVDEALMRMNLLHESFLCFNNIETHQINVVYRRDDGTHGLIETTH